jgi:hypothetical protein
MCVVGVWRHILDLWCVCTWGRNVQTHTHTSTRTYGQTGRYDEGNSHLKLVTYRSADKSLAPPTSRCILLDGENIFFDASLVAYINGTNIPPV